jgi:hypothetical protein
MKRIVAFFFAMLLIVSISAIDAQAQTWVNYEAPAEVSAVAVSNSSLFVFGQTNYFEAILPLPENPNDITWISSSLPAGITTVSQAGIVGDEIFILMGDELWKKLGEENWHFEFDGVSNMKADGERLFVWFDDIINIYTGNQWILDGSPEQIACLGFEEDDILTFDYDRTMYLNGLYWSGFEDFNAIEVTLDNGVYTAVGNVIGSYAAYYSSDLDHSFKYIHVLSLGELSSIASAGDKQYAAGQLNGRGVIFDVADLSDYTVFDSPILQIRSNGGTIVGIDGFNVYVRGQITGINSGAVIAETDNLSIVNPVCYGVWQINAKHDAVINISNLLGQTVITVRVNKGKNNLNLNLSKGLYIVDGKKIMVN